MPDLELTDIPEDLYNHLHEFARQDKRFCYLEKGRRQVSLSIARRASEVGRA